ncbi:MAG TPA: hypothetical protein VMZ53_16710 [Kofleriaceae bacterium]|nr:hypothetical protein [Kofleriaceae bacterium]
MRNARRWLLGVGGIVIVATVGLVVVRPRLMAAEARELMANDPCVLQKGPPRPSFFRAIELADTASKYPGVDRDRTDANQSRCVATFASACIDIEGRAITAAIRAQKPETEWRQYVDRDEQRVFCNAWAPLIELIKTGRETVAGCRYCDEKN